MHDRIRKRPARFLEDLKFLRGEARFVDDINLPGTTHALFYRSPRAHALIRSIDIDSARASPGVIAIFTGADIVADALGGIPWEVRPPGAPFEGVPMGSPDAAANQPLMACDRTVYVGEIVAMVIAEQIWQAQAALDLIEVEFEELPAQVSLFEHAIDIWPTFVDNTCFRFEMGDEAAFEKALASAHLVVEHACHNQRISAAPMEPRAYIGWFDSIADVFHLKASAGKPHFARNTMATNVFRVPSDRIVVETPDVGGGFGAKNILYPEECLVVWAAKKVGQAVKWVASRSESFGADLAGRDQHGAGQMIFDQDGLIRGYRVTLISNLGAYLAPRGVVPVRHSANALSSVYKIPTLHVAATGVFTNTTPTCSLRGTGAPEMAFLTERILDMAAEKLGMDSIALRRRNLLHAADMPYVTPHGVRYDSGDPLAAADHAARLAAMETLPLRRAESKARGRLRGLGVANGIEILNVFYDETVWLDFCEDGRLLCRAGTQSSGQGHASVIADLIADELGCDPGRISLLQGDTQKIAFGNGTGASRSTSAGGSAALIAARNFIANAGAWLARMHNLAPQDVNFRNGVWRWGEKSCDLDALHALARQTDALAELSVSGTFKPKDGTYPYGCSICEVEVDPETGVLEILNYVSVHDVGRAISPQLLEGQVHGSTLQGLGQALCEQMIFDLHGQLLTGTFMDYAMPVAGCIPHRFESAHLEIASPGNPLGAKGVGESGTTTAPPALINAIIDALRPLGVKDLAMPATPMTIWKAIQASRNEKKNGEGR